MKKNSKKRYMKPVSIVLSLLSWFLIVFFVLYLVVNIYFGRFIESLILAMIIMLLFPQLHLVIKKRYNLWVPILIRLVIVVLLLSFYVHIVDHREDPARLEVVTPNNTHETEPPAIHANPVNDTEEDNKPENNKEPKVSFE